MGDDYHGHLTHKDGSHAALTKDQAEVIWGVIEAKRAQQAQDMPQPWDATAQIISAKERLQALGWKRGGGLSIAKGQECAVVELSSTGMWSGWLDSEGVYVHYAGCVSARNKVWLKRLSELTEDERKRIAQGDKDAADWLEREIETFASMEEYKADPHA
ncbi:MAG: hypothetical protein AAGK66_08930 [Pseudomonadota bacterium]